MGYADATAVTQEAAESAGWHLARAVPAFPPDSMGDLRLAAVVALALFVAGGLATGIGLLLPWLLHRLGLDPAYGSGPLATIIQDVLSLAVYFLTVSLVVQP